MPTRANANPSKNFFIAMLTRDIDLVDCILDLLDNSVDGIGEAARRTGRALPTEKPYNGYKVELSFDRRHFSIKDRSGGIPINVAQQYAFRFGRPDDAPPPGDGTIGIYGIGMKRAMFKMGNIVKLESSTGEESFALELNVDRWRQDPQISADRDRDEVMEWSFDLSDVKENGTDIEVGTSIWIEELYEGIWRQFDNPYFSDRLHRMIARDYAFILSLGLEVSINGSSIAPVMPAFRESADISPFRHVESYDGVNIEIIAGIADPPPEDTSATARNPDIGVYGWYVVCNDRVVVSADKSSDTGWGVKPVPSWHPQFIGFMGVARFTSANPALLPWKTTKRDVETGNTLYQRAIPIMMRATKHITDYTNARRTEAKRLRRIEKAAPAVPVSRVITNTPGRLPATSKSKSTVVLIQYVREASDVSAVAESLGMIGTSPSEVGIRTFEYYLAREVSR